MQNIETQTINFLNRLITTNQDAADGFRSAIGGIESDPLKRLFEQFAEQREFMVIDLQSEAASLGTDPLDGGSLLGLLQRGWMNLKATISGHDVGTVLEEVFRYEDWTVDQYREALSSELPHMTRELLEQHVAKIQNEIAQLRALERAAQ